MSDKYYEGQRVLIMEAYGLVESYGWRTGTLLHWKPYSGEDCEVEDHRKYTKSVIIQADGAGTLAGSECWWMPLDDIKNEVIPVLRKTQEDVRMAVLARAVFGDEKEREDYWLKGSGEVEPIGILNAAEDAQLVSDSYGSDPKCDNPNGPCYCGATHGV